VCRTYFFHAIKSVELSVLSRELRRAEVSIIAIQKMTSDKKKLILVFKLQTKILGKNS
jgi:hypothetical protein